MKQRFSQEEFNRGKVAERAVLGALRKQWLQGPAEGRVFLAISGGVDSMTLLEGLHRLLRDPGDRARLEVVHVNHALRGKEADGDENLVLTRAGELGLPAHSFRLDWAGERPSQDRCRRRREDLFGRLCVSPNDRVWLAHHLNDQAETVFFRLLRGTGARGLRGMLPRSGAKVRPFLGLEKDMLRSAAGSWKVAWREDRSNLDLEKCDRNWLRGFFPSLEKRRPGFQRKLAALAEEARSWRFEAEPALDLFPFAEGIAFTRLGAPASPRLLSEAFSLSRRHAMELAALLRKPAGVLEASGQRFTWSAGLLLSERGIRFHSALERKEGRLLSALGTWELADQGAPLEGAGGESRKKELQSLKVPVFFRPAMPVVSLAGRPVALHPRRKSRLPFAFAPSPLAAWWLEAQRISTVR